MSYEGSNEYICANWHYTSVDVSEPDLAVCPVCGADVKWHHHINETNGVQQGDPTTDNAAKKVIGTYVVELPLYAPADQNWSAVLPPRKK